MISKINKYSTIAAMVFLGICSMKSYASCDQPLASGVDWSNCVKRDVTASNVDLNQVKFVNTTFLGVTKFTNVKMYLVDFTDASVDELEFVGGSVSYVNFINTTSHNLVLFNGTSVGATFTNINFNRFHVINSRLSSSISPPYTGKVRSLEWRNNIADNIRLNLIIQSFKK